MSTVSLARPAYIGRNAAGARVYRDTECGFDFMLTACCNAAVSGSDRARCKACGRPAHDDTTVVSSPIVGRRVVTEWGVGVVDDCTDRGYVTVALDDGDRMIHVQAGTPGWDRCTLL